MTEGGEGAESGGAVVVVSTADLMRDLGRRVAGACRPGDLLILSGGLGAGKTTFVQGLGVGLGVRGPITSPTFVIARVHPPRSGGPALLHVDAYRLGGLDEVEDLDLDTSLAEAVTVVEWGQGLVEQLAEDRLEISIERSTGTGGGDTRRVRIRDVGARWGLRRPELAHLIAAGELTPATEPFDPAGWEVVQTDGDSAEVLEALRGTR